MAERTSAEIVLEGTSTSLVRWVENEVGIPSDFGAGFLSRPTYANAKTLVNAADNVVHVYISAVASIQSSLALLVQEILHTEVAAVWTSWVRTPETAGTDLAVGLAARLRDLLSAFQAAGNVPPGATISELRPQPLESTVNVGPDAVRYLALASVDQLITESTTDRYTHKLAKLQTTLGLRPAELAGLLRVSREAVRRWFEGASIAADRWPSIDRLERIRERLTEYFRAETLPAIIRREIPGLGNRTALELIQADREDELLAFYHAIFRRRVTQ